MTSRTFAAALLALTAAACADNRASLQLRGICAGPKDACTYSSKCDLYSLGEFTFDASLLEPMTLAIEVGNQLPNNADPSSGRLNTNDAHVTEVVAEYDLGGLSQSSTPIQQTVPANGTTVVFAYPFSAARAQDLVDAGLSGVITAKVRLKGIYDDGSSFETGAMDIPVTVCQGGCVSLQGCETGKTLVGYCPSAAQNPSTAICQ
jgi:hypothetical protein